MTVKLFANGIVRTKRKSLGSLAALLTAKVPDFLTDEAHLTGDFVSNPYFRSNLL
jgi:hypothetical protein